MKKTKRFFFAFCALILLTGCGQKGKPEVSSASSSVSSESSQKEVISQVSTSEMSSSPTAGASMSVNLTDSEKKALRDLVQEIQNLPQGSAGSSLASAGVLGRILNEFAFYAEKQEESNRIIAEKREVLSDPDMYMESALGIKILAEDYQKGDPNVKNMMRDAGVSLAPKLNADQLQAFMQALTE